MMNDNGSAAGGIVRRSLLRDALGAGVVVLISTRARMAAAEGTDVTIDNFSFSPTPLTVKTGTTITWTNRDDIPHSIVCPELKMKSHPLDTNDAFSYRFSKPGTYNYICGLHPHMHGQVVVSE
jgi:plastocyanin